jgi:5-methylthioribose kinase
MSYERWIAETVSAVWQGFHDRFLGLWRTAHGGDAYPPALFAGERGAESLHEVQRDHMRQIFEDALRFAGVEIIRATLGRHQVRDFEQIEDRARRAAAKRPALLLARELIKDAHYVSDMAEVMEAARRLQAEAAAAP